ncbi:DUF4382 domain-containing protein [Chloroflexota bacterium]
MSDKFEKILNECIDRVNAGQTVEYCLAEYPDYADDLVPMLDAMFVTKNAFEVVPVVEAKPRARQRMMAALRRTEEKKARVGISFPSIFRNVKILASAAAALIIAFAAYFGIFFTSTQIVPAIASADGSFALLISDEANAIGDFTSLTMIVDEVHLRSAEDSKKWIEIDAQGVEVDLVQLQGDNALQIWRGFVDDGDYTEALLYSSSVTGVLASGGTVQIKLPSKNRLSLKGDFTVADGEVPTDFVYDITVIKTGSGSYNLQPNTSASGTGQPFQKVGEKGPGAGQGPVDGQDDGQGQGDGPSDGGAGGPGSGPGG